MGAIRPPRPANLVCGFISADPDLVQRALRLLSEHVGRVDEFAGPWPFDDTDYYALEMGETLHRWFAAFQKLIDPVELAALKILTNQIERRICEECGLPRERRLVNLDPGYVTLAKLVLATSKDYSHRIYLRDGIYAESTLHFHQGAWLPWPWTYPDYAGPRYHAFLLGVRERLKEKLIAENPAGSVRGSGEENSAYFVRGSLGREKDKLSADGGPAGREEPG